MKQTPPIARAARLGLDVELRVIRNAGRPFPNHWHDDLQIIATIGGRAEATVDGRRYALRTGSLIMIPPGAVHTANAPSGEEWTFQSLHAAPERFSFSIAGPVLFHPSDPADRTLEQFGRLTAAMYERGKGSDALPAFAALMAEVGRRVSDTPVAVRAVPDRLLAARAAVAVDLRTPVSIPDVAARFGWSAAHFSRRFKSAFFMPPLAWRLNARIESARRRLRQGGTVVDAAAEAGFADLSHFSRQYRFCTGITARSYAATFNRCRADAIRNADGMQPAC